jgi:8-oxo-dGTP diphosphatase
MSDFSADTALLLIVAAALIDENGRVLVQKRPNGGAMPGLWEFPGGKIERGETPEMALIRELNEELGIRVDPEDLMPACFASEPNAKRHMILMLYICRRWSGDPTLKHASEMAWHPPVGLRELAMPPADIPFISYLERLN